MLKQARAVNDRQSPTVGLSKDFQKHNGLPQIAGSGRFGGRHVSDGEHRAQNKKCWVLQKKE